MFFQSGTYCSVCAVMDSGNLGYLHIGIKFVIKLLVFFLCPGCSCTVRSVHPAVILYATYSILYVPTEAYAYTFAICVSVKDELTYPAWIPASFKTLT